MKIIFLLNRFGPNIFRIFSFNFKRYQPFPATPVSRLGAAGGFQSTVRMGALTFGATLVTLIFAWCSSRMGVGSLSNGGPGVKVCLYVALFFAIIAGVFSLSRVRSLSKSSKSVTI